jgi:hypothetical protein
MRRNERKGPGMLISDMPAGKVVSADEVCGVAWACGFGCAPEAQTELQKKVRRKTTASARGQRGEFTAGILLDPELVRVRR